MDEQRRDEPEFLELRERVAGYQFPDLIERLLRKLSLSRGEIETLFIDLKLWLFLCGTHRRGDPPLLIVRETAILDELWHEFILFTEEYTNFCNGFFGAYVHHRPTSEHEKQERKERFENDPGRSMEVAYFRESTEPQFRAAIGR